MASKDASKSVMGNLPSTRPARIGGRRERAAGESAEKPKAAPAKPKPKAKSTASKPATAKPKAKSTASKPAQKPTSKPRAVRSGSPALKAAKDKKAASTPPRKPQPAEPPKGTELVTTAVQAAGELAQIGLTLGGRAVKRAVRRLPKP
jgi:hypothetical protein